MEFGNKASATQFVKYGKAMDKRTGVKHSYKLTKVKGGWKVTLTRKYKKVVSK